MKTICYFSSSCFENIGNAFIDIGSILSISESLKDDTHNTRLIQTSMFPCLDYTFSISPFTKRLFKLFWRWYGERLGLEFLEKRMNRLKPCDNFNLAASIKPDIVIVSGCVLTVSFFKIFGDILNRLKKNKVKLIFYGVGGNTYSHIETEYVSKWLDDLQPYAIITRDSIAFSKYKCFAEKSFDGCDSAFFANYLPLKGVSFDFSPYVVLNFDKFKNKGIERKLYKKLASDYNIIKTSHVPHPDKTIFPVPKKDDSSTLISENPYDYLLLYANAEKVYSDRIHACIVSLAYGVPCRLYSDSPRLSIFSKVAENDGNTLVRSKRLDKLQKEQLNFLSAVLSDLE
ncbi:MAG: polysaccharide pyruvyl transferase family protein [Candidatus Methanospirare jalkutatii]|nr:polysaccharide pyruvyl transferase family protein [Candidatus Methanospirare jalkutatii]